MKAIQEGITERVLVLNEPDGSISGWRFERVPRRDDVVLLDDTNRLYRVEGRDARCLLVKRFVSEAKVEQILRWDGPPLRAWLRW